MNPLLPQRIPATFSTAPEIPVEQPPVEQPPVELPTTRRALLRELGVAAAAAGSALALLPEPAAAQVVSNPPVPGFQQIAQTTQNFRDIRQHENAHATTVAGILGSNARPRPTFRNLTMPNVQAFIQTSYIFENTGVAAYAQAAPYILNPAYLASAASIALIESRHAGWLNTALAVRLTTNVLGQSQNFERGLAPADIAARIRPYIASFNGGPEPTYSITRSAANDIMILNFALVTEYLEQEFYNINVPRFFGTGS